MRYVFGFVLLLYRASAFTVGVGDNVVTVGFVRGDDQRDTISLFISCIATLSLCVYSAVHLNVPVKGERHLAKLWKEVKWCIIGLFGPELVLYTAWRQWASAKQLCDEVQMATRCEGEPTSLGKVASISESYTLEENSSKPSWSIAHGFYGTMGGFVIDLDETDPLHAGLFRGTKRLTLTAKGVALLAHCGRLPQVSVDDIKDKNKTDSLAKLLVCIQAGWMVVQVISRTAVNLPTSLLEVHTVAHVVCALLMYIVWWHKPRQVGSPTLLQGDWILPLAAYMYSASRVSGQNRPGLLGKVLHPKPEMKQLIYFEEQVSTTGQNKAVDAINQMDTTKPATKGYFTRRHTIHTSDHFEEPENADAEYEFVEERRRLAAEAVAMYPALRSKFERPEEKDGIAELNGLLPYSTELVQPYSLNWPNAGLLRRTQSLVMGMVLWGTSMAYGAIHVSAWEYFFPTEVERLLWRMSSVWVTFCAAFWLLTNFLGYFFPLIDRIWVAYNDRRLGWAGTGIITMLCILCGVSYVVSRAYLVIEAFVSLRMVPSQVYNTPTWSQVFPHL